MEGHVTKTKPNTAAVADQVDTFGPHAASTVKLYGRGEECATLARLLESASDGIGSTLVIRGEAGIGKSALLGYLEPHCSDALLVRARGVEGEMALAFAGLQQLLSRWIPEHCRRSPGPQRDALERAFGHEEGQAPDRFLVAMTVMSLLAHLSAQRPVVCLIDDAQWLDGESIEVLGFVARRVTTEHVAIVFAVREPDGQRALDDLPELLVSGLRDDDACHLLTAAIPGQLDSRVRDRIVAEAQGNPRALIDVPRGLTLGELAAGFGQLGPRATSCSVEASFHDRMQSLPDETQQVLLVAAAEGIGDATIVRDAIARLGIDPDAVALAETAGLVEFGINVRFPHPLARAAAYRGASTPDRRSAHRALAAATDPSSARPAGRGISPRQPPAPMRRSPPHLRSRRHGPSREAGPPRPPRS